MKRTTIYFCACLLLSGAVNAAENLTRPAKGKTTGHAYVSVEAFEWKETIGGDEVLEESGPLFGIGGDFTKPLSNTLDFDGRGRFFFGQVDYDGALIAEDGSLTPYKSDTVYGGFDGELDLGRPFPTRSGLTWKPFAGLGIRSWLRALDSEFGSSDGGEYGYEEYWFSFYGAFGIAFRAKDIFGRLAVRAPMYNQETVDLSDNGGPDDVELEPGEEISFSGDIGMEFDRYFLALYFETLEFSESDPDDSGVYYQPESEARIFGLRGGLVF